MLAWRSRRPRAFSPAFCWWMANNKPQNETAIAHLGNPGNHRIEETMAPLQDDDKIHSVWKRPPKARAEMLAKVKARAEEAPRRPPTPPRSARPSPLRREEGATPKGRGKTAGRWSRRKAPRREEEERKKRGEERGQGARRSRQARRGRQAGAAAGRAESLSRCQVCGAQGPPEKGQALIARLSRRLNQARLPVALPRFFFPFTPMSICSRLLSGLSFGSPATRRRAEVPRLTPGLASTNQ